MEHALSLLQQKEWRIIDQSNLGPSFHALHSFAIDDTLCKAVGSRYSPPTARAWVHHQTVVLGIQDTKLPFLTDGLKCLKEQGYQYIVRNSGGLAVVLDEGVLNLSLIFPDTEKGIDIDRGYDAMYTFVREMFADFPAVIEAREIVGSYCPGSYDLSINGRKFAGISQRRMRKGVAVQVYLCVYGSGKERAEVLKTFYKTAKKNVPSSKFVFPDIRPEVMASLSELLETDLAIADVMLRFFNTLKFFGQQLYTEELNNEELKWYEAYYERLIKRNERSLSIKKGPRLF